MSEGDWNRMPYRAPTVKWSLRDSREYQEGSKPSKDG